MSSDNIGAVATGSSGVAAKDVITWILTCVSLLWNWYNTNNSKNISLNVRKENFDYENWKRHSVSIFSKLNDFDDCGRKLTAPAKSQNSVDELKREIDKYGRELVEKHEALISYLERYECNQWPHYAYGKKINGETEWDLINACIAECSISDDADIIKIKLLNIKDYIKSIVGFVNGILEQQTAMHVPK